MEPGLAEQYALLLLGQLLILTNQLFLAQSHQWLSPAMVKRQVNAAEIAEFIERRLCDTLSVDMISRQFYMSKTKLYYLFMEVYGTSVGEYISDLRITKAKNLLINSDSPMDDVAQAVGYQNTASFSRAFKAKTNCSPKRYRMENAAASGKKVSAVRIGIPE